VAECELHLRHDDHPQLLARMIDVAMSWLTQARDEAGLALQSEETKTKERAKK
jgi:hypothetical protein